MDVDSKEGLEMLGRFVQWCTFQSGVGAVDACSYVTYLV
jgi:hypothetical protein